MVTRPPRCPGIAAFLAALFMLVPAMAHAQSTLDDEPALAPAAKAAPTVRYGVQLRGNYMFVPKGEFELFAKEVPSGMAEPGFALDFVRRKDKFELVAGLGYNKLRTKDGLWLEKNKTPPTDTPDLVTYDGLGALTAEVLFMWRVDIAKMVSFRYGAGFGLAFIIGDALQTDTICTGSSTSTCSPITAGGQVNDPADIFPVYPLVNLRGGIQVRPTDDISINIDAGLRTAFFVGTSVAYFF